MLVLAVRVLVSRGVRVTARLFDTVVVADWVLVLAALAVAQEVCVADLELLVDDVYVAEEVDVFVEDAERVVAPELVSLGEDDAEPVAETVCRGIRLRVPVTVSVMEGRRVALPQEVEVAERVRGPVADADAVAVSVKLRFGVADWLREIGAVGVSARQRVGLLDVERVLDSIELRVGVALTLNERDKAGENVPDLEDVIVRVPVPDAVGVLDRGPLRVPVEETVDVFD
jgi:hypothetical protein